MLLKHKLQILKPVYTENGSGGQDVAYVADGSLMASLKETGAEEAAVRGKAVHIAKYELTARKSGIEADRRLLLEGKILEIDTVAAVPGGPPFYQILSCREARRT
jgi:head-tail adaptor